MTREREQTIESVARQRETESSTEKTAVEKYARYTPTLSAVALTLIAAAFVPGLMLFLAIEIGTPFEKVSLQGAVCRSLIFVLPLVFASLAIHKSLKVGGLAENNLHWHPEICRALLYNTRLIVSICLPLVFIETALEWFDAGRWHNSLGRLVFIANMTALAAGLWITSRRLSQAVKAAGHSEWRQVWARGGMFLVTLLPIVFVGMSAMGYQFTAMQLSWRLFWTLSIGYGIALGTGLVYQLMLIAQFRIKLRQTNPAGQRDLDNESEDSIDISEISSQVNRLLRVTAIVAMLVAAWQIWHNVVPAINYLDNIGLWKSANSLTDSVTPRDVLMAIGLLAITFVLSRNLPGLLEIVVLERLPLDRGGRYALSFVLRYFVGIVGILFASKCLGFSWTSVQWLAAGLTVGLGFGLQEIFANLVSGIIILVERPIRVGDFVTVNDVTGTVTRMQLRATTLMDLDHREWIVPNKKFITDDVMNWTLSDSSTRIIFPIGVAYGSDTQLVQRTLLQVADDCPNVLKQPNPEVVFSCFGDSSLTFELKVMIPKREIYYAVQHEMNMAIDVALRAEKIEIAFPQTELRIHGMEGVIREIQVTPPNSPAANNAGAEQDATAPSVPFDGGIEPSDDLGMTG